MQSDKQHIDDFFRRKEEAFTPDEQYATAHWQQMQKQLAEPEASVNPKNGSHGMRRIGKFLGGLLIVAIIAILVINTNRSNKKVIATTTKQQATKVAPQPIPETKQHTLQAIAETTKQTITITTTNVAPVSKQKAPPVPAMTLFSPPITRAETSSEKTDATAYNNSEPSVNKQAFETKGPKPNAQTSLKLFFDELEKEEQTFYIQADRDTTLIAKEGTQLVIPANTLYRKTNVAKGRVTITMREYYKNEDIVAAKLSTTSNGKQLVTGGMVHIIAEQDGEPVTVAPQKTITINMPADKYDTRMQLFKGIETPGETNNQQAPDWMPVNTFSAADNDQHGFVTMLNINEVDPFSVSYGDKTTARFRVNSNLNIPKQELIAQLKKRFGTYYDIIKLKRYRKSKSGVKSQLYSQFIIDSIEVDVLKLLKTKKVTKEDSLRYMILLKERAAYVQKQMAMHNTYSFALTGFGWINCDRFSDDPGPKVTFVARLDKNSDANNYVSMLVFKRYQSVLRGYNSGGRNISFYGVPADEPAVLITVTINDDKVVSNIQPVTTANTAVSNLVFEPITPEQFKQKLQSLFAAQQQ